MFPLIEEFHKHKISEGHTTDMESGNLRIAPFNEFEQESIKNIKIGVSRNLADFPLGPLISKS